MLSRIARATGREASIVHGMTWDVIPRVRYNTCSLSSGPRLGTTPPTARTLGTPAGSLPAGQLQPVDKVRRTRASRRRRLVTLVWPLLSLHRKLWDGRTAYTQATLGSAEISHQPASLLYVTPLMFLEALPTATSSIVGSALPRDARGRRSRPCMQHCVGEPPRGRLATRLMSRQMMDQGWLEPRCQLSRVGLQLDSAMSLFVMFTGVTSAALWSKTSKTPEARP